jgi:hypothetical protein
MTEKQQDVIEAKEVRFLLDRLANWENEHLLDGDAYTDWAGHVAPSIARLKIMLSAIQPVEEGK